MVNYSQGRGLFESVGIKGRLGMWESEDTMLTSTWRSWENSEEVFYDTWIDIKEKGRKTAGLPDSLRFLPSQEESSGFHHEPFVFLFFFLHLTRLINFQSSGNPYTYNLTCLEFLRKLGSHSSWLFPRVESVLIRTRMEILAWCSSWWLGRGVEEYPNSAGNTKRSHPETKSIQNSTHRIRKANGVREP